MKFYSLLSALIIGLLISFAVNASAQNGKDADCFITGTYQTQGMFKTNSDNGGKGAPCAAISFRISSPVDNATGHTSGKRQHEPLMITKYWDKSSPQYASALAHNETLKTASHSHLRQCRQRRGGNDHTYECTGY